MPCPTQLKPVSSSHYREFLYLSSQMGLRLTGTAGLSQPILGLSCCCWISCSLACNCKEASCRLGLQGSSAESFGAEEALHELKETKTIPLLSCRGRSSGAEQSSKSADRKKARATPYAVWLLLLYTTVKPQPLLCKHAVCELALGQGMGWPIVWHRSTCVLSEMRSAH